MLRRDKAVYFDNTLLFNLHMNTTTSETIKWLGCLETIAGFLILTLLNFVLCCC